MKMILMTLVALASGASAHAFSFSASKSLFLGAGLISQDAGRFANTDAGKTSYTSAIYSELTLSYAFSISSKLTFFPLVGYTPLGYKGADANEKSYIMPIILKTEYNFDSFEAHAGPGLWIYKISGKGGTATLSNGTGTAVFGLPDETHSTQLLVLDLGFGTSISDFKLAVDAYVSGLMSSRRAANVAFNVSYGIL